MGDLSGARAHERSLAGRLVVLSAVFAVVLLLASSVAEALPRSGSPAPTATLAGSLTPCDQNPDRLCGDVPVPLDRANPTGAQIAIHFEIIPHTGSGPAANDAILVTSGGPGISATHSIFGDFVAGHFGVPMFAPLLEQRDLILLDQRGVGLSQAIDCPGLQQVTPPDIYKAVADCGAQLGDTASLYGSAEVARDIEAVRQALGIDQLDFYGASYAGVDAQAYAARFPDHLRTIVLDSPVKIVGFDPFSESAPPAIERAVRLICERSANCSADHGDAGDDLEWLARRLRRHPLDGVGYDPNGSPHTVHVSEGFLAKIAYDDPSNSPADSEIAAAARSLRHGDGTPLLRLAAEGDFEIFAPESDDPTVVSAGDNWARGCIDLSFPWDRSASLARRQVQWEDAVGDLERDDFEPFSVKAWLSPPPLGVYPDPCIAWPAPNRPVELPVPARTKFADVPTLALSGDYDNGGGTTSADVKRVARLFPGSRFVEIANASHHTVITRRFECAASIVVQFVEQLAPGDTSCAQSNEFVIPAVGRFPEKARKAKAAKIDRTGDDHSEKADRRVATVAAATITDAFRRTFEQPEPHDGLGLRGGTVSPDFGPTGATVDLTGTRFAEDVSVSGTATVSDVLDATVTVDGPRGEDGTLHVTGIWFDVGATTLQIRGTLGGRQVALLVPAT
jgi:pimeloyl-ACP methyl ester carboxylesterase